MALREREIAVVNGMVVRGDRQHHVGVYFGVSGGRIAEISTGQAGSSVTASPTDDLPPVGLYMSGRSALSARDTLTAMRDLIQEAINDIDL